MPLTIKLQIGRFTTGNWWCRIDGQMIEHRSLNFIRDRVEEEIKRRIYLEWRLQNEVVKKK